MEPKKQCNLVCAKHKPLEYVGQVKIIFVDTPVYLYNLKKCSSSVLALADAFLLMNFVFVVNYALGRFFKPNHFIYMEFNQFDASMHVFFCGASHYLLLGGILIMNNMFGPAASTSKKHRRYRQLIMTLLGTILLVVGTHYGITYKFNSVEGFVKYLIKKGLRIKYLSTIYEIESYFIHAFAEYTMTTASVLLTVTTTWNMSTEKMENGGYLGRNLKNATAEAAKELRENSATRDQAITIMREWIQQNTDIKNVRTDESFLLRFLRHKKYSLLMAQQTILKYLNLRNYYPEIFKNLHCDESRVKEVLSNGYIMVSPVRDSKGRRVIVYNMSKFNAHKFNCWDMCRAHVVVYESLIDDQVDQMCGYIHVGDGSGVSGAHVTTWNPTDFARLLKWGEQSLPMRHKEFHMVNVPSALKYVVDFAVSKVTPKMASRVNIYTNVKQLHQNVDPACLPTSYGGAVKIEDMLSYTAQILREQRKTVIELDHMQILSTRGIMSSRNNKSDVVNGELSIQGSFRKLEID